MADEILKRSSAFNGSERGVAAVGTVSGFAAFFSAAACCVLPLAFAALGLGVGGLAAVVPYHWPLTIASAVAVVVGWAMYFRKRRTCTHDAGCTVAPPSRTTLVLLCVATAFVALSVIWPGLIEAPLMAWLASA